MKTITPTLAICMVAAGVGVVAAVADLGAEKSTSKAYGGTPTLAIQDFHFSAATVSPGSTLTVTNLDEAPHTVTAADGSFDSGRISGGGNGSLVAPTTPGTYSFYCDIHPSMVADLVVAGS